MPTTKTTQDTQDTTASDLVAAHTAKYAIWEGDLPKDITGPRACHLAVTVGFGSLQRVGHKRPAKGDPEPTAPAVGKAYLERGYTAEELQVLIDVGSTKASPAAAHTVAAAKHALGLAKRRGKAKAPKAKATPVAA